MGGRAASYFLSDPFAYWHQTCDIHQINRAVGVSLPWHKASSEMFINIALFPMNESCVPSERATVHTWTENPSLLCSEQRGKNATPATAPSTGRRWSGCCRRGVGGKGDRCDLWRAGHCYGQAFLGERSQESIQEPMTSSWKWQMMADRLQNEREARVMKIKKEMRLKCQMDFPSRKSVRTLQGGEAWGKDL